MEKYIPKSALVAEIKKKIRTEQGYSSEDAECGYLDCAREILSFLDTLEAKDVDLEKEIGKYLDVNNIEYGFQVKLFDFAKHFFELGLKAQKGE